MPAGISKSRATLTGGGSVVVVVGAAVVVVVVAVVVVGAAVVGAGSAAAPVQADAVKAIAQTTRVMGESRTGSDVSGASGLSRKTVGLRYYSAVEDGGPETEEEAAVRVVIAGCGRVGSDLALSLADSGHDVSVVDINPDAFRALGSAFNGTTHEGPAYDIRVLRDAGIEFADAFAACTSQDNANLMSVQVATQVFGVPKTVARLDDPRRTDAYRALRVRHVAGGKLTSRAIRDQLVDEGFQQYLSHLGGGIELIELLMSADADGITVSDLEIEGKLQVAAVRRGLETFIGDPDLLLEEDDLIVAAAVEGIRRKVRRYLKVVEA